MERDFIWKTFKNDPAETNKQPPDNNKTVTTATKHEKNKIKRARQEICLV